MELELTEEKELLEVTEQTSEETWNYEKMSSLLGLTAESSQDSLEVEPEAELELEQLILEEEAAKKSQFSQSPWSKLGLIAGCTGIGFLTVGFLFTGAPSFHSGSRVVGPSREKEVEKPESPNQLEVLKAELALARQDQQMRELAARMDSPGEPEIPTVVVDTGEEEVIPQAVEAPSAPQPSTPVGVSPGPPSQAVVARPVSVPAAAQGENKPGQSASTPTKKGEKPEDSMATWQELASLGSYGGAVVSQQPVASSVDVAMVQGEGLSPVALSAEEQRLLGGIVPAAKTLRLGTRIPGEIVNSVIVAEQNSAYIAVITSQPVVIEGQQVLPVGTEVVFGLSSIHSSGMVFAEAISLVVEGREIEVPSGVLQLRAPEGKPLIAQKHNTAAGEIARRDATGFVIGALGKVGEVANRPQSVANSGGDGSYSHTTTYNSPDFLGAVLEGGFNPLSRQWEQRNQQEIRELQQRGDLWVIPLGQPVEIIVNRSFTFEEE